MGIKCPKCGGEIVQTTPEIAKCKNCGAAFKRKAAVAQSGTGEKVQKEKKKGMSISLLISFIIGMIYVLYSIVYWSTAAGSMSDSWEQLGAGIATALVMPHLICTAIAVIFNALGLLLKKRGFALTGAILYSVAMVLFPMYFMYVIVEMILSYVGFAKMPK